MAKAIALKSNGVESYPVPFYEVGEVCIMSTNTNPNNIFGYGTWSLIDKEYESTASNSSDWFTPNSNCELTSCYYTRGGHTIQIRLNFQNKVELADTNVELGTFNFESLGVTSFPYSLYNVIGATDGGNAVLTMIVNYSTGILTHAESTSDVSVNSSCYLLFAVELTAGRMIDTFCDKFYWKRTA